jgi:hypothetical protein
MARFYQPRSGFASGRRALLLLPRGHRAGGAQAHRGRFFLVKCFFGGSFFLQRTPATPTAQLGPMPSKQALYPLSTAFKASSIDGACRPWLAVALALLLRGLEGWPLYRDLLGAGGAPAAPAAVPAAKTMAPRSLIVVLVRLV